MNVLSSRNAMPEIGSSTREERERYILEMFQCRGDCDACGFCAAYHGKTPETVYADYIEGTRTFLEISQEYRR